MEISTPNEYGCLTPSHKEIVAQHGRSYAAVYIARREDGRYRMSVGLSYSYGGFGGPIDAHGKGYESVAAARNAGMDELLRAWHNPFPSDPQSVHDELRALRQQIERQLCQPSFI